MFAVAYYTSRLHTNIDRRAWADKCLVEFKSALPHANCYAQVVSNSKGQAERNGVPFWYNLSATDPTRPPDYVIPTTRKMYVMKKGT